MKKALCLILALVMFAACFAGCSKSQETYMIKWLNYDGTVLEVDENVPKGAMPEYNGETPTKPADDKHKYVFVNWFYAPVPAEKDVAYTAQFRTASKIVAGMLGDEVDDMVFEGGKKLIENYVPGGGIITQALDFLFSKKEETDPGPSLSDIKDDLDSLRSEISDQFKNVEDDIAALAQQQEKLEQMGIEIEKKIDKVGADIETLIVNQTELSLKENTFSSLLSSFQAVDRQLKAIHGSQMNDQSKAVQIAMLIGRNSEWTQSSNLYNQYLGFLDTITGTTFGDIKNRDALQIIYDNFYSEDLWFSGEVVYNASFYVNRLTYLALEAYGVCYECLTAARDVSCFSSEDVAALDDASRKYYDSGAALSQLDVIESEMKFLNEKLFWTKDDTVVSFANRLKSFYTKDCNVFIHHGKNLKFDDHLLYWKYDGQTGKYEGDFDDAQQAHLTMNNAIAYGDNDYFGAIYYVDADNYNFDRDSAPYGLTSAYSKFYDIELFRYFKDMYPEKTVKDVFAMLGYDLSEYPEDTVFIAGFYYESSKVVAATVALEDKVFDGYVEKDFCIPDQYQFHATQSYDISAICLRLHS